MTTELTDDEKEKLDGHIVRLRGVRDRLVEKGFHGDENLTEDMEAAFESLLTDLEAINERREGDTK